MTEIEEEREEIAQISIKNNAMFYLGNKDYENLDQESKDKVDKMYETTLLKCLSSNKWGFATEIVKLEQDNIENLEDGFLIKYNSKYTCPDGFIRLLSINTNKELNFNIEDYFLKKNVIYCNRNKNEEIYLKYIQRINSDDLPAVFREYFEYSLAIALLFNFTGNSNDLQLLLSQNQELRFRQAIELDAVQKKNYKFINNPYLDCRY